jgi:CheY-like chemotaxis protein
MGSEPKRILIVEDHEDTLRLTAAVLSRAGYEVKTATTLAAAFRICDEEKFDLLLSDVRLPDGDGSDLIRKVAARCNIKSIAYTGLAHETDAANAKAAGFSAHLLKPADIDTILQTVARVLGEP